MGIEGIYLGDNIDEIVKEGNCQVYQMSNETGEGHITAYEVFKGVYLMYNDFHMDYCVSEMLSYDNILCIDHCREGRIEEGAGERCTYVSAGDIRVGNREGHDAEFSFPFAHYHGISIAIMIDQAQESLEESFKGFPVILNNLKDKYCAKRNNMVIREIQALDQLFGDLYQVPHDIRPYYFKIKIYEVLLYLDALQISHLSDERPYFYKTNVEKVKAIHRKILSNLDKRYTIESLSEEFDIPLTTLKKCFKGVYGSSIYAYTKDYRINLAAKRLKTTDDQIADIAFSVGYTSPSKFTAAFKNLMGYTPQAYRQLKKER